MLRFFICLSALILLAGCTSHNGGPPGTKKVIETSAYGEKEQFFVDLKTNKRHGPYLRFRSVDTLLEKANYLQGQLHGKRYLYYPNGQIQTEETHLEGEFDGLFKTFYADGKTELAGQYVNNMMEGIWKKYYETGELFEKVTFANNQENGPFTEYYKNGVVHVKGTYLNGDHEHGELLFFNENGDLTKRMDCDRGLCRTVWNASSGEPLR